MPTSLSRLDELGEQKPQLIQDWYHPCHKSTAEDQNDAAPYRTFLHPHNPNNYDVFLQLDP